MLLDSVTRHWLFFFRDVTKTNSGEDMTDEGEEGGMRDKERELTSSSYFTNCRGTPAISASACSSTFRKVSCACASLTRY